MPRIFHVSNARPDNKSQLFRLRKICTWIVRTMVVGIGVQTRQIHSDSFLVVSRCSKSTRNTKVFHHFILLGMHSYPSAWVALQLLFHSISVKVKDALAAFFQRNSCHSVSPPWSLRRVYHSFENIPFNWLVGCWKWKNRKYFLIVEAVDVCAWNMLSDSVCAPSISVEPPTKYPYRFNLSPFKRNKIIISR